VKASNPLVAIRETFGWFTKPQSHCIPLKSLYHGSAALACTNYDGFVIDIGSEV
jgi:hypothetical protein